MKKKIAFSLFALNGAVTYSFSIPSTGNTITTTNTLYYSKIEVGDSVNINTTANGTTAPLGGFGVYLNNNNASVRLDDAKINTSGTQADAIRFNGGNNFFFANTATINASGTHADGINIGLVNGLNIKNTNIAAIEGAANIAGNAIGVRANNYAGTGSKSIILLGDNSTVKSNTTGSASNAIDSIGYGVYAGSSDKEQSGMSTMDRLLGKSNLINGDSYIFIGDNSIISSKAINGHSVFSNQGGLIQLGANTNIEAAGVGGYALYAESKATDSNNNNARGATIYLEGGAKLRVHGNTKNVIQANGKDAIIKSAFINKPIVDPLTYTAGTDVDIDITDVTETSGIFDIIGNISSINGGEISLNMSEGSKFIGSTSLDTNIDSKIDLKLSGDNSIWELNKDSSLTSLTLEKKAVLTPFRASDTEATSYTLTGDVVNNGGIISLVSTTSNVFDVFTINGNYSGNDGYIIFDTVLHDDTSESDNLIITGNTSGNSKVKVQNIGGVGAETIEGIKLITVNGESLGNFEQEGRIVAGAYDYFLRRGNGDTTSTKDWYLSSNYAVPIEPPPIEPPPIEPPPIEPPPGPTKKVYRPESGSYIANLAASKNLFVHRLHDRLGEANYTDSLINNENVSSIWVRNVGGYNKFNDKSGQLKTTGSRYILHLGGDIAQWSNSEKDRYHVGLMAGYARSSSTTDSRITNYSSDGKVSGYSLGTYGTWYSNEKDKTGFYTDIWAMYSWFDNEVQGEGLAKEKYNSNGLTASLEIGYTYEIDEKWYSIKNYTLKDIKYYIQPKGQIIYLGVDADNHTEKNGTYIKSSSSDNIQTRLGVRFFANNFSIDNKHVNKEYQPFLEVNWIHNTEDYGVVMDNIKNNQEGVSDIAEIKLGVEIKIKQDISLWGNFSQQWGASKYRDTRATIGAKYLF